MPSNQVEPYTSDTVILDTVARPKDGEVGIIVTSGKELAIATSQEVAIASQKPSVQYDVTEFVEIPEGSSVPSVTDPASFDHFKRYVKSKLCYNSDILDKAVVLEKKEGTKRIAFQVDIWSLMEQRTVEKRTKPYRGESTPGQSVGNIFDWTNLPFDTPSTTTPNQRTKSHSLTETQQKIKCPLCDTDGKQQCSSCYGKGQVVSRNRMAQCSRCRGRGQISCSQCAASGYLLEYYELKITWNSLHSMGFYQNSFLPNDTIRYFPNKPTFFDGDHEWTNDIFLTSFGSLFRVIGEQSPFHFGKNIQQQYQDNHFIKLKDSTIIRRLKCLIRYIEISEIDYKLDGYINETERNKGTNTFTYLQYGQDDKGQPLIYENDYPLNCCGCFGPKGSCRCSCTIL